MFHLSLLSQFQVGDSIKCVNSSSVVSCAESRKHKEKNWEENDFYDSDEDNFLDRTGSGQL